MFVRNGAVTPGLSRECDITFFVKGRPKSVQQSRDSRVVARRVQSVTVPSSRVSRECRSPGLRSPPLKNAPKQILGSWNSETDGEIQKGRSFLLTARSFSLAVGLCCLREIGLVFALTDESGFGLFCLRSKMGWVFIAFGFPRPELGFGLFYLGLPHRK